MSHPAPRNLPQADDSLAILPHEHKIYPDVNRVKEMIRRCVDTAGDQQQSQGAELLQRLDVMKLKEQFTNPTTCQESHQGSPSQRNER